MALSKQKKSQFKKGTNYNILTFTPNNNANIINL